VGIVPILMKIFALIGYGYEEFLTFLIGYRDVHIPAITRLRHIFVPFKLLKYSQLSKHIYIYTLFFYLF